jgi:cation:H+ antiporter
MVHALAVLILTGAAVAIAGIMLGRAADDIANITALGEMWTGWVLLAAATSLPEFVTDVSAVRLHAANLAAGDLFGSSLTNMAILAVMALVPFAPDAHGEDSPSSLFGAWLAIALTALGAAFTLIHSDVAIAGLRPESATLVLIWIIGTRILYSRQNANGANAPAAASPANSPASRLSLRRPLMVFAAGSAIIFLTAPSFADSARRFAAISGLGDSFVGTWLLGFSTALPEFVTSITVCRLGAFDLAVANLYGSCAFNMVVFFAMDLASPRAPVFSMLDPVLALSGFLAVALMVLGLAAVAYRRGPDAAANVGGGVLLASYGFAIWLLYLCR